MHSSNSNHGMPSAKNGCKPALGRPLRGVIVPLVTPLLSRDTLDVAGLERLTTHVLEGGVHGIFLLGTTGEAAALCGRVRRELVRCVCRHVDGRVPVLVGISDTSLVESLRLAHDVADAGAAAVVITTPYYLPLESQELVGYVRAVSVESPLPVFLYNMPELAKTWFSIDVLTQCLDLENVVGLKDSSADVRYFEAARAVITQRSDWSLLIGSDSMMAAAVQTGAHGGVTGGANVCPRLFASLYEAAVAKDHERTVSLQKQVLELSEIYRFGGYAVGSIRGIKSALHQMGIASDRMAAPFYAVNDTERRAIGTQLSRMRLLRDAPTNGFNVVRIDGASAPQQHIQSSPLGSVSSQKALYGER